MNEGELIVRTGYRPKILRNVVVFKMTTSHVSHAHDYNQSNNLHNAMHDAMASHEFRERYVFLKSLGLDGFSYERNIDPAAFQYVVHIMIKMSDEDYVHFALRFE